MNFATPIEIGGKYKNAVVHPTWPDSFIQEDFYKELGLTVMDKDIDVASVTIQGTTYNFIGIARVSFSICELLYQGELRNVWFGHDFMVCSNIEEPVVLGRDFMLVNYLNFSCGIDGVRRLMIPTDPDQQSTR